MKMRITHSRLVLQYPSPPLISSETSVSRTRVKRLSWFVSLSRIMALTSLEAEGKIKKQDSKNLRAADGDTFTARKP